MYHILIVDNKSIEREGILFLIREHHLPLITHECANGTEALKYLETHKIDILLTDIKMPFMNGLELVQAVRATNPTLKIIIFSAYGEFEYARKAITFHVIHYILKPVVIDEFLSVMEKVMKLCQADNLVMEVSGTEQKKVIQSVLAQIQKYYNTDISVEQIAQKVYLSPSYLSTLFKKEMGQNLLQFIIAFRMEKAKEMLDSTNMKMFQIAKYVGYSNDAYFCTVFKNHFGITPSKWRERK